RQLSPARPGGAARQAVLSGAGWRAFLLALGLASASPAVAAPTDIIPAPVSAQALSGVAPFRLGPQTLIVVPAGDAQALDAARELQSLALKSRGLKLALRLGATPAGGSAVVFVRAPAMAKEAYALEVGGDRARITAADGAGLFYGVASLWQLMTPDDARGAVSIRAVKIEDQPRFAWRGLLLDSARHYQSPAFIEQMIDWMTLHKLNVLQWHLTDDQAWRLQIPKYPRLTQVGAWRAPTAADSQVDPKTGKPLPYGGFYTAADVRRLVAYAEARGVTIVPEIEMPGHALSAILAYPELGSAGPAPSGIQGDWGVFPYIYNYDDHTFAFLEDVLTEVMALFPSRYINIGGDEAVSDQWKASPQVQARMKALGVANEAALQGVFLQRIETFLNAHGRRLVGWDEILGDGLPADATVMSWHGVYGALAAARAGHDAVLAPSPVLYFDHRQSDLEGEPPGRGTVVTLKDVYGFDPAPGALTEDERRHILGLQANVWTEHIRTPQRVEAMTFPRAAAVAEIGWSPAAAKDWPGFLARLPGEIRRYKALGLHADESALALAAGPAASLPARRTSQTLKQCTDKLTLNLEDDAPLTGPRAVFLVDIMNPCWMDPARDLSGGGVLTVAVGNLPFNYQLGPDLAKIVLRPTRTPEGELEVRADSCTGDLVASLPLARAALSPAVTSLSVNIPPRAGRHDLCLQFTAKSVDPIWALDWVQFEPFASPPLPQGPAR
ncbi:MAG TPA: family 20 glycosylhydrolase, partial [Caulobacteraceae bacterium]